MIKLVQPLFDLFFPPHCPACEGALKVGENTICTSCRHKLPVTDLHYTTQEPIHQLLYGRVEIKNATALFYFNKKGLVQQLIHNLKYRNHIYLSSFLGNWLGAELKALDSYNTVDCVIPVPLHKNRLRKRGFNQVEGFGKAIAEHLSVPMYDSILYRRKNTTTQVFKSREGRSREIIDSFAINQNHEELTGKHLLLVDDLITTGGTIEGCVKALHEVSNIKISLAVMAIAQ